MFCQVKVFHRIITFYLILAWFQFTKRWLLKFLVKNKILMFQTALSFSDFHSFINNFFPIILLLPISYHIQRSGLDYQYYLYFFTPRTVTLFSFLSLLFHMFKIWTEPLILILLLYWYIFACTHIHQNVFKIYVFKKINQGCDSQNHHKPKLKILKFLVKFHLTLLDLSLFFFFPLSQSLLF